MTPRQFEKLIGPRVTAQDMATGRMQFLLPTLGLGFDKLAQDPLGVLISDLARSRRTVSTAPVI